jgi:uncharacterized membrane protein
MTLRRLTLAVAALAVVGLAVSGYLTVTHYAGADPWCTALSDCETVQSSDFATVAGVPVALLGLLGYAGILVSLLVRTEHGVLATAFLAFVGFGYSVYLTSVEAFRLEAWCQWCVVSALLMTAIAVLAALRVLHAARADVAPRRPVHG